MPLDAIDVLVVVLLVSASVLCGVAIWALRELVSTSRSLKGLTDDTRERLVPLLDKADVTVDAVNAELLRIDGIITRFEDASEKVSHASGTISNIVSAPGEIANEMATRVRKKWGDRRRAAEAEGVSVNTEQADTAEAPSDEAPASAPDVETDWADADSAGPWRTDDSHPTED